MTLKQILIAYAATAVVFLALDAVWLTTMADRLYRPALGRLMLERFELAAGGGVLRPLHRRRARLRGDAGPRERPLDDALGLGALLGLVAYATYDLTNQATLRGWPWRVTIADLCWGTFVTAAAAGGAAAASPRGWLGAPAPADGRLHPDQRARAPARSAPSKATRPSTDARQMHSPPASTTGW